MTARKIRIKPPQSSLAQRSGKHESRSKDRLFSTLQHLIPQRGFTLVEFLVAIIILGVVMGSLIIAFNPATQRKRVEDIDRQQTLQQIKNALETYYHDTNCYPTAENSPFVLALSEGGEWKEGSTLYIKNIPNDPNDPNLFVYKTDDTTCPQWSVVFTKLSAAQPNVNICPLSSISDTCVPEGYDETWACGLSGAVNCELLALSGLAYDSGVVGGGEEVSPTPVGPSASAQEFFVAPPPGTNPQFYQGTIDPLFQAKGKTQTLTVNIADTVSTVSSVSAAIKSDTKIQSHNLTLAEGTGADGIWKVSYTVDDTTIKRYQITFTGVDSAGNSANFDIAIR